MVLIVTIINFNSFLVEELKSNLFINLFRYFLISWDLMFENFIICYYFDFIFKELIDFVKF
jgi:hypothetical protein